MACLLFGLFWEVSKIWVAFSPYSHFACYFSSCVFFKLAISMICLLHNFSVSYSFSYTAFVVVVVVYMHVLFYFSKLETLHGQQAVWFSTLS